MIRGGSSQLVNQILANTEGTRHTFDSTTIPLGPCQQPFRGAFGCQLALCSPRVPGAAPWALPS
jgi:hypothetical protein